MIKLGTYSKTYLKEVIITFKKKKNLLNSFKIV